MIESVHSSGVSEEADLWTDESSGMATLRNRRGCRTRALFGRRRNQEGDSLLQERLRIPVGSGGKDGDQSGATGIQADGYITHSILPVRE